MSQQAETRQAGTSGMEGVQQLLARAERGDAGVVDQLRAFLDEHPEVWQQAGDLARHAELALLDLAAGNNLLIHESLSRKLAELKRELGPASALERLLGEGQDDNYPPL